MRKPTLAQLLIVLVLGVLFPIMLPILYGTNRALDAWVIQLATMPACAVALAAASRGFRPIELAFYTFVYVFFCLAPTAQMLVGEFPWGDRYSLMDIVHADAIVAVGVLCFAIGSYLARHRLPLWTAQKVRTLPLLLVTAGAVALFFPLVGLMGGVEALFLARDDLFAQLQSVDRFREGLAYLMLAQSSVRVPVMVLSIVTFAMAVNGGRLRWLAFVLVLANLLVNNPISTARFLVGTYLIAYFIILGVRFYPRKLPLMMALGIPALFVLLFPLADYFRVSLEGDASNTNVIEAFATKPDFDALQLVMDGVRVTEKKDFQLGQQMLGSVAFWVPRSIWTTKPDPTGVMIGDTLARVSNNLSAPLWIEFYMDFWWFGVALGMAGYGYLCRRVQNSLTSDGLRPGLVITAVFAGYQFYLLRGSLMVAMSYLIPMALVLFCVVWKGRRVVRTRLASRPPARFPPHPRLP